MPFDNLSAALWRQRDLFEILLYKLEVEELLISNGRTRWLGRASQEVEVLLERIRSADLSRAIEADAVVRALGIESDSGLRAIADAAPEPWGDLLNSHRAALVDLTTQISTMSASNRELMSASAAATREALLGLREEPGTYSPTGGSVTGRAESYLIDKEM